MKYGNRLLALPVMMTLFVGCNNFGSATARPGTSAQRSAATASNNGGKTTVNASNSGTNANNNGTDGTTGPTGCAPNGSHPIYEYTVAGWGTNTRDLPLDIGKVQSLRVQITPLSMSAAPAK